VIKGSIITILKRTFNAPKDASAAIPFVFRHTQIKVLLIANQTSMYYKKNRKEKEESVFNAETSFCFHTILDHPLSYDYQILIIRHHINIPPII
jgi:hypothetical protein